ncbi:MAG: class I SAM-dependent RNA methyltransferase [Alphaproteobacteria bacterium]|nr:class I SAM-dependent RNA methyltransferase [Alphaproteobacteria bacterium]
MSKCPFFGLCGGCKFDFDAENYKTEKLKTLPKIDNMNPAIWGKTGTRRRADFAVNPNAFGFYKNASRDIINIDKCPNLLDSINRIIPDLAKLPWQCTASVLVTQCDNGIVVNTQSDVPYFNPEFKTAVQKLPNEIIRFTWNDTVIRNYMKPKISFDKTSVDFPDSAFLQPTTDTEKSIRDLVVSNVGDAKHVVDLFCGIGNFTFATNATGFDIMGIGINRDLFKKPLSSKQLNQYDAIIMDPPRAGALSQTEQIAKSNVKTVVYVSCNPGTWNRDKNILLRGGYKLQTVTPIDQFVGSPHWEIFSVFKK